MSYLYAFIDESGNWDFSPGGTTHWVLTSLLLLDPTAARDPLFDLKHQALDDGIDLPYFHAAEDRQLVRNQVFDILEPLQPGQTRVDAVVVRKNRTVPSLRAPERFYPMMVEQVLKYQFDPRGVDVTRFEKVMVFLDRPSGSRKDMKALTKALKQSLPQYLRGVPYGLFFHPSSSHHGLQMVDYLSWAIYVKWERHETRPYDRVKHLIRSEFDIFAGGNRDWY